MARMSHRVFICEIREIRGSKLFHAPPRAADETLAEKYRQILNRRPIGLICRMVDEKLDQQAHYNSPSLFLASATFG